MNQDLLKVNKVDNDFIISFYNTSRINSVVTDQVKEQVIKFLEIPSSRVVLNLDGISFIDTYSFNAIQELEEIASEYDSVLGFMNLSQDVKELVQLVELDSIFKEYNLN